MCEVALGRRMGGCGLDVGRWMYVGAWGPVCGCGFVYGDGGVVWSGRERW